MELYIRTYLVHHDTLRVRPREPNIDVNHQSFQAYIVAIAYHVQYPPAGSECLSELTNAGGSGGWKSLEAGTSALGSQRDDNVS